METSKANAVVRRLGGLTRRWRFDRMATVCSPALVEKANHAAAQRWWRTLADTVSVAEAQASLDRRAAALDGRRRVRDGQRLTVAELAAAERLRPPPPVPYPAQLDVVRVFPRQPVLGVAGHGG